jgi:hypothetical protein
MTKPEESTKSESDIDFDDLFDLRRSNKPQI